MRVQRGEFLPVGVGVAKRQQMLSSFRVNLGSAKVGLNSVWKDVVKMVETAPHELKNDAAFGEMDRAFKMFDMALKKLESKAAGSSTNWQGR